MHHSFIYRNHRIDVDLRPCKEGWIWCYDLNDGREPHTGPGVIEPTLEALQSACIEARQAVDRLLSK